MSKPRTYNHTSDEGAKISDLHPELVDAGYYQRQRAALEAILTDNANTLVALYNEVYDHPAAPQSETLRRSLMSGMLLYLDSLRVATEHVNFVTSNISGAIRFKRLDAPAAKRNAAKETTHDSANRPYPH